VFNVVKLSAAPDNPISGRKPRAPLPPIVVDGEPEWEVEEVLDSRWHRRRFQFLIKWKGFSKEYKGTPLNNTTTLRSYPSLFTSDT